MNNDSKILIRKPFGEQYTITIDSEVNGIDVFVTSVVQLRYDFQVLRVQENSIEIRLVQLDNLILEANNPMIREVAQVSQVFGRMYNELHLELDASGTVIKVLNTDFILSKWKQTKAEMEKYISSNDNLKDAIILNDDIFNNPEKIKIAVQANEFLRVYFGQVFDVELPFRGEFNGTNIFNTYQMDWNLELNSSVQLPPVDKIQSVTVTTLAKPRRILDASFYKSAYSQFEHKIDLKALDTQLSQTETRIIDYTSGRVQEAEIRKTEVADEKRLFNKLKYTLKSDRGIVLENEPMQDYMPEEDKQSGSKFKFF